LKEEAQANIFFVSRISQELIAAAKRLDAAVRALNFKPPVTHVYNPLSYAWPAHEAYLRRFGSSRKQVVFLGMNPGPFGMAQTGVPFGEIAAVRNWLKIESKIGRPECEHPKRPVDGFDCLRSEVSGQRLWGLFAERFGTAQNFFKRHIVMNYCPLAFIESTGRNRTPDKLRPTEKAVLFAICDEHLKSAITALQPEWVVAVGDFAYQRAQTALANSHVKFGRILHPSPASPAANRDWAGVAARQLHELGVWSENKKRK
jgi:single-strand selective monofunctional uracil DNA glycosylase